MRGRTHVEYTSNGIHPMRASVLLTPPSLALANYRNLPMASSRFTTLIMVQYSELIGLYICFFHFLSLRYPRPLTRAPPFPWAFYHPNSSTWRRRLSFTCTPDAHNQWSLCYTPTRNFDVDVDVDVDGACIAAGDHNFFGIRSNSSPIPLPVVGGVLGGRSS